MDWTVSPKNDAFYTCMVILSFDIDVSFFSVNWGQCKSW